MIEYIRSFLDEITVQALQINILIWLFLWIVINLFNFITKQKLTILNSKYKTINTYDASN